ncbi:MAG: diacylglycerol kinase family protein, partial [Planctomycetaceae bacterium]
MQHAGPRRVIIQRNPTSGTGRKRGELLGLVRRLRVHGYSPRLFSSRDRLDRYLSNPEHRTEVFCVVAAGGDGTVADVVNRCHGLPVAILALGTENLIARYLNLPRDGAAVADMIAAGHRRRLDTWSLNGRRFLIMAGFGFDAEVVRRTSEQRRGNISKW